MLHNLDEINMAASFKHVFMKFYAAFIYMYFTFAPFHASSLSMEWGAIEVARLNSAIIGLWWKAISICIDLISKL